MLIFICRIKSKFKCLFGVFVFLFCILFLFILYKSNYTNVPPMNVPMHPNGSNDKFIRIMNARVQRVQKLCKNRFHAKRSRNLRSHRVYWLPKESIAYCPIFKSASTTWRHYLFAHLNQTHVADHKLIAKLMKTKKKLQVDDKLLLLGRQKPSSKRWKKYVDNLPSKNNLTGFLVVRHPFDRLVSAYRDKLERKNLEEPYYYEKYGKKFVKRYRKRAIDALGKEYFYKSNNFGTPIKVENNLRPNSDLPSFWEFVESVTNRYFIDEHWAPINEECSVCNPISLKVFRYILKFEELATEAESFLNHKHWDINRNLTMFKFNSNHPGDIPSEQLTQIYFSVLSHKQILKLYKVYESDFLLFNYTFKIGDLHLPTKPTKKTRKTRIKRKNQGVLKFNEMLE